MTDDARFWRQRYTELLQTHTQFVAMLSSDDKAEQVEQLQAVLSQITGQLKQAKNGQPEQHVYIGDCE
jgi:hypothetical protein